MKKILDRLEDFDKRHGWDGYNNIKDNKERLNLLQEDILNLLGELGELANEVKKCRRDDVYNQEKLNEETIDVFIFLLKITKILDIDIEEEFNKKMDLNEKRFVRHLK